MPYIHILSDDEASGPTKRELEQAYQRAGRVWNIVRIMTQNGHVMRESMHLYGAIMFGESPLSRMQREMLATVTSSINHCVY